MKKYFETKRVSHILLNGFLIFNSNTDVVIICFLHVNCIKLDSCTSGNRKVCAIYLSIHNYSNSLTKKTTIMFTDTCKRVYCNDKSSELNYTYTFK